MSSGANGVPIATLKTIRYKKGVVGTNLLRLSKFGVGTNLLRLSKFGGPSQT